MLYELIAVVRTGSSKSVRDIANSTSSLLLSRNATIRSLCNWGIFDLPRPTIKHQTTHYKGHYFVLRFDGSSQVQNEVRRQLALNPLMIRFSVVKLGDKLGGHRNQTGKIEEISEVADPDWTGGLAGIALGDLVENDQVNLEKDRSIRGQSALNLFSIDSEKRT